MIKSISPQNMSTVSAESFLKNLCGDYGLDDIPADSTSICDLGLDQADLLDIEFRVRQIAGGTSQQLVRKLTRGMTVESLRKLIEEGQLSPQHFSKSEFENIMVDSPTYSYLALAADHGIDPSNEEAVVNFIRNELPKMGNDVANDAYETVFQEISGLPQRNDAPKPMTVGRLREILCKAEKEA